jgi:hypothetical protein
MVLTAVRRRILAGNGETFRLSGWHWRDFLPEEVLNS